MEWNDSNEVLLWVNTILLVKIILSSLGYSQDIVKFITYVKLKMIKSFIFFTDVTAFSDINMNGKWSDYIMMYVN